MMPYGAAMCIAIVSAGYLASKYPNMRCFAQFLLCFPSIIGAALGFYIPADNKGDRLSGFYLTAFSNGALPIQFSL